MDNNTNPPQQTNPPSQPSPDAPVFSSSDLTQTKARRDTQYFTNVQKATPWRRLSNWFNKLNRESLERSATRKAALKAKLDERRRAADLAAISAAVPDLPTSKSKFARSATRSAAQPTANPAQPTAAAPAPRPVPPSTGQPTPAPAVTIPAPAGQSTVIIENPSAPRKSRLPLILALVVVLIIIIIGTILIILQPWANNSRQAPSGVSVTGTTVKFTTDDGSPVQSIDIATATPAAASAYQTAVLDSTTLNVYEDDINENMRPDASIVADNIDQVVAMNNITDPAALLLFDIEKAYVFMIYGDYDSFFAITEDIDEDSLYPSQQAPYYRLMCRYYRIIEDEPNATVYCDKATIASNSEAATASEVDASDGESDEEN